MTGGQILTANVEGFAEQLPGLRWLPFAPGNQCQLVEAVCYRRASVANFGSADRQGAFEELLGLVISPLIDKHQAELVPGSGGGGVVVTKGTHSILKDLGETVLGGGQPALKPGQPCQARFGTHGPGVLGAERRSLDGERALIASLGRVEVALLHEHVSEVVQCPADLGMIVAQGSLEHGSIVPTQPYGFVKVLFQEHE